MRGLTVIGLSAHKMTFSYVCGDVNLLPLIYFVPGTCAVKPAVNAPVPQSLLFPCLWRRAMCMWFDSPKYIIISTGEMPRRKISNLQTERVSTGEVISMIASCQFEESVSLLKMYSYNINILSVQ